MSGRVLPFPASPIIRALQQLQRPVSAEAERMAASVLIEALVTGEVVPPGTLQLVCSTLVRTATTTFGVKLAEKMAELDDHLEVLVLGQLLVNEPATRAAGMALLRRLG